MGDYLINPHSPKAREQFQSTYNKMYPCLVQERQKIFEEAERLISKYMTVLSSSDIIKARTIFWGCDSSDDYSYRFISCVLAQSYNVWDESHLKYVKMLKLIERYNPEWKQLYVDNHERKIKLCKRPIYDCEVVPSR